MSIYTICGEFFRECCSDEYYAFNVLFEFIKDNDRRIAVDRRDRSVLKIYADICREKRSKHMAVWLKQMAANQNRNIELITVDLGGSNRIFLDVARHAPNPKKILIWSDDHYQDVNRIDGVIFLDREAAKQELSSPRTQSKTETMESGMKNVNITAGPGTNIIIGSKLTDSMNYLQSHVSDNSARMLKSIADCVEASGSQEAGDTFDKLSDELGKPGKSNEKVTSYVARLFEYIPDMARIGKSVQDVVEILAGS